LGLSKITEILIVRYIFRAQISPKSVFGRALPRIPLRELDASLAQTPTIVGWEGTPLPLPIDDFGVSILASSAPRLDPRRCGVRRAHQMVNPTVGDGRGSPQEKNIIGKNNFRTIIM